MTLGELKRLTRYWQKRLRLQEWNVHVELQSGLRDFGRNDFDHNTKTAAIYIRDLEKSPIGTLDTDSPVDKHFPCDEEEILVHELGHILTSKFVKDTEDPVNPDEEFCLNVYAKALVDERRGA